MALMMDDLYSENILDEPDELERIQEGGIGENHVNYESDGDAGPAEVDLTEGDKEKENESSVVNTDTKKKRKQSQRPKLNIIRLMDQNNGLLAAEKMFKDVKFKGKGYEHNDLNLIMKKMEIWAHKLYPSMQFDDCLAKLEKLGTSKSVTTYVKKLRLGLEDDLGPQDEVRDSSPERAGSPDPFDQLITSQRTNQDQAQQNLPTQGGLTKEQKERMLRNRLIAEQRRMARMKAYQEKLESEALAAKNGDETIGSVVVETTAIIHQAENTQNVQRNDDSVTISQQNFVENRSHKLDNVFAYNNKDNLTEDDNQLVASRKTISDEETDDMILTAADEYELMSVDQSANAGCSKGDNGSQAIAEEEEEEKDNMEEHMVLLPDTPLS